MLIHPICGIWNLTTRFNMNYRLPLLICSVACICSASSAAVITSFGSDAEKDGAWSWNSGTSTLSGTEVTGDTLYGVPYSGNFGDFSAISITANATTAPLAGFTFLLEDTEGRLAIAQFFWLDFVGGNTVSSVVQFDAGFDKSAIGGWQLASGGSGSPINVVLTSASAIPEPSAAVALAGVATLGFAATRRRHRVAS